MSKNKKCTKLTIWSFENIHTSLSGILYALVAIIYLFCYKRMAILLQFTKNGYLNENINTWLSAFFAFLASLCCVIIATHWIYRRFIYCKMNKYGITEYLGASLMVNVPWQSVIDIITETKSNYINTYAIFNCSQASKNEYCDKWILSNDLKKEYNNFANTYQLENSNYIVSCILLHESTNNKKAAKKLQNINRIFKYYMGDCTKLNDKKHPNITIKDNWNAPKFIMLNYVFCIIFAILSICIY